MIHGNFADHQSFILFITTENHSNRKVPKSGSKTKERIELSFKALLVHTILVLLASNQIFFAFFKLLNKRRKLIKKR